MNTIIIHPNNRVVRTPMHDLNAALISPVSKWYIKPVPWWLDFEEVGLHPIEEADESADEDDEDVSLAGEANVLADATLLDEEVINCENVQCFEQGEYNDGGVNVLEDIELDDTTFKRDIGEAKGDYKGTAMGVDVVDRYKFCDDMQCIEQDGSNDSNAPLDLNIIDEDVTFIVEIEQPEEWDEKAMLNIIVVELNSEEFSDIAFVDGASCSCSNNFYLEDDCECVESRNQTKSVQKRRHTA